MENKEKSKKEYWFILYRNILEHLIKEEKEKEKKKEHHNPTLASIDIKKLREREIKIFQFLFEKRLKPKQLKEYDEELKKELDKIKDENKNKEKSEINRIIDEKIGDRFALLSFINNQVLYLENKEWFYGEEDEKE